MRQCTYKVTLAMSMHSLLLKLTHTECKFCACSYTHKHGTLGLISTVDDNLWLFDCGLWNTKSNCVLECQRERDFLMNGAFVFRLLVVLLRTRQPETRSVVKCTSAGASRRRPIRTCKRRTASPGDAHGEPSVDIISSVCHLVRVFIVLLIRQQVSDTVRQRHPSFSLQLASAGTR